MSGNVTAWMIDPESSTIFRVKLGGKYKSATRTHLTAGILSVAGGEIPLVILMTGPY